MPVLPGLMCINAFGGFKKMTGFCLTRVPPALMAKMEEIQVSPSLPALRQESSLVPQKGQTLRRSSRW